MELMKARPTSILSMAVSQVPSRVQQGSRLSQYLSTLKGKRYLPSWLLHLNPVWVDERSSSDPKYLLSLFLLFFFSLKSFGKHHVREKEEYDLHLHR